MRGPEDILNGAGGARLWWARFHRCGRCWLGCWSRPLERGARCSIRGRGRDVFDKKAALTSLVLVRRLELDRLIQCGTAALGRAHIRNQSTALGFLRSIRCILRIVCLSVAPCQVGIGTRPGQEATLCLRGSQRGGARRTRDHGSSAIERETAHTRAKVDRPSASRRRCCPESRLRGGSARSEERVRTGRSRQSVRAGMEKSVHALRRWHGRRGNAACSRRGSEARCLDGRVLSTVGRGAGEFGLEIASRRHALLDQSNAALDFDFGESTLTSTVLFGEEAGEQIVVARDWTCLCGRSIGC